MHTLEVTSTGGMSFSLEQLRETLFLGVGEQVRSGPQPPEYPVETIIPPP